MISGHTRVFALLGHPVGHSLSPELHNRWFAARAVDAVYVALDVPPGTDLRPLITSSGVAGFNVTAPHKGAALAAADELTAAAREIGAVNTLFRRGDAWVGDNTDALGFRSALGAPPRGPIVILGAGGAARAVRHALQGMGSTQVRMISRVEFPSLHLDDEAWVINCAAATATPDLRAWAKRRGIGPSRWFDLNYWDPAVPGSGDAGRRMLVLQAAAAFHHFTGITLTPREVEEALACTVPRHPSAC